MVLVLFLVLLFVIRTLFIAIRGIHWLRIMLLRVPRCLVIIMICKFLTNTAQIGSIFSSSNLHTLTNWLIRKLHTVFLLAFNPCLVTFNPLLHLIIFLQFFLGHVGCIHILFVILPPIFVFNPWFVAYFVIAHDVLHMIFDSFIQFVLVSGATLPGLGVFLSKLPPFSSLFKFSNFFIYNFLCFGIICIESNLTCCNVDSRVLL